MLSKPLSGATLHKGGVDMTVYSAEAGAGSEVVATYVTRDAAYEPLRMAMLLEDGDTVTFGLPDRAGVYYTFSREDGVVRVKADTLLDKLASR